MEHPPPQHPYDLSLTLEQLNQTVNQTYHISHSGRASFPRYAFPVWLSVSAENPVGQGATSLPLKYTPPTPEGCLRLYDMVSGELGSEVTLTDTASVSVEIQLFQQPFQNGVDYCFDTVVVTVSVSETVTGNGGGASGESGDDGETHVLVPILSETGVSVVLESHLEEDTHYTATLSFNSHLISTFTFSTYAVQDVSIVEMSNGLRVECSFAEGSSQNTCTVVLVLDGVEQERESSSGEMTFPDLATGLYTVLVYDSGPDMEGSGRSPALEREVEVTDVTTSTTPSVPASPTSDPTTTEEPSIEGVTDGGGEPASPSNKSVVKGRTLLIVIGVVTVCAVIFLLIVCILLCKWLRNRSTSYSVQKTEKKAKLERTLSASNPIPDSADVEESISPYSEISRVQQPTTAAATTATAASVSDVKKSGVGEYEVVDMEEGREGKRDRVRSAALPEQEYTEEELREIRSHTYSTVNKTKGKRQDISPPPPPVPPQNFDPSQEFSDSTESDVKQDLSMAAALQQATGNHLYDSLQPSTPQCGNAGQAPPPVPAKASGDPVYESISGPAVGRGRSSNSSPSSSHSQSDDRDDSQLIVPSPPPRTHGVVPDIPYRPLPVSLHNGSRHSMGEGAAISTEDSSIHRPKSMYIQLTSDPEGPRQRDQYYSMGQKMSSMPLLLQYDL